MKPSRLVPLLGASLVVLSACVLPPLQPTPEDVARAQERFPGVTLETLAQGRTAYLTYCSGCHHLYPASKHKPDEWAKMLPEMAKRAKLDPPQQELILTYLATMSTADRRETPATRIASP